MGLGMTNCLLHRGEKRGGGGGIGSFLCAASVRLSVHAHCHCVSNAWCLRCPGSCKRLV